MGGYYMCEKFQSTNKTLENLYDKNKVYNDLHNILANADHYSRINGEREKGKKEAVLKIVKSLLDSGMPLSKV